MNVNIKPIGIVRSPYTNFNNTPLQPNSSDQKGWLQEGDDINNQVIEHRRFV